MPASSKKTQSSLSRSRPERGQDAYRAEVQARLGSSIKRAEQAMMVAKSKALREYDLSVAQYAAMLSLYYAPGQSAAQLARAAAVTPQTMATVLARLEAKKLITRVPSEIHSRVNAVPLTPAAGQIAINVHYAGASYVEALFAGGFVPTIPVPWVPGLEASGTVRAYGEGVTEHDGLEIGTPVAAFTVTDSGGYGQIAVTNAHLVAPIPEGLDAATAAAVPANTTAALIALERLAQVQSGQSVLVQAAAGGLGSQLGQVARYLGASRVVGVVGSEQKRHAALELGYDEVILRDDLAEQEPDQFDIIVDPVGGPTRARCVDLLRVGGRLLVVGDAAQAGDQLISSNDLWLGGKSVMGFNLGALTAAQPELVGTYLRRALQLVADGEVKVPVTDVVPITQAPSVLARLRAGSTVGKTVLKHEAL